MSHEQENVSLPKRSSKWRKRAKRCGLLALVVTLASVAVFAIYARHYVRSIYSIERIPNTNMYVMDYYGDYNIAQIHEHGIDLNDVEGSLIRALLPKIAIPIAEHIRAGAAAQQQARQSSHSCSTVSFKTDEGQVYFLGGTSTGDMIPA